MQHGLYGAESPRLTHNWRTFEARKSRTTLHYGNQTIENRPAPGRAFEKEDITQTGAAREQMIHRATRSCLGSPEAAD